MILNCLCREIHVVFLDIKMQFCVVLLHHQEYSCLFYCSDLQTLVCSGVLFVCIYMICQLFFWNGNYCNPCQLFALHTWNSLSNCCFFLFHSDIAMATVLLIIFFTYYFVIICIFYTQLFISLQSCINKFNKNHLLHFEFLPGILSNFKK